MKKMKLVVGQPVMRAAPKDTFQFELVFMHGDADAYTKQKLEVKDYDLACRVLSALNELADAELSDRPDARTLLEVLCGDQSDVFEVLEDFAMEGDVTSDHQFLAMISEINITYFDANGIEYLVSQEEENV